jgi:hypothetical protein
LDEIFLAELAGLDGAVLWTETYPGDGENEVYALHVDSAGDAIMTGLFHGTLGTEVFSALGNFVAKLSGLDGAVSWVTRLDATADWLVHDIDSDSTNRIYLAGNLGSDPFVLGDDELSLFGACMPPPDSWCETDGLVVRLSPTGSPEWTVNMGSTESEEALGLAMHGAGGVTLLGAFSGPSWSFGSHTLSGSASTTRWDFFLASISVD